MRATVIPGFFLDGCVGSEEKDRYGDRSKECGTTAET